jgi:exonuclease SbcC
MIRRITLQNYMSHAHTVIEPAEGLTVLVGPNNCGKSAVVSALETLCNNASGDYMVRHDEKEASVTVETDDGHTFLWRRDKSVSYVIDGREISRLKRGVPEDLHKLLRLPKVDGGETDAPFDIHFGTQKSPIFLLNEPPSRATLFFASSSDAAILLEMQKRHRNKVKERKSDEKRLKGEIEKLDAESAALEPLDALAASVAKANDQYRELKGLEGQIQTLGKEREALRAHLVKHDRLVQEYQCLAPLKPPPHLADTSPLESLITDLVDAECQLQRERARSCALESLDSPPALDDMQKLESLCRALSHEEKNHPELKAKAVCLGLLNDPPVIDDTGPLERIVADLESAQLAHVALSRQQRVLESLTPPPELADPEPLAKLIRQLAGTFQDVAQHQGLMSDTASYMDKLEARLRVAERAGAGSLLPGPAERRPRRRILMALGSFASMAAVLLLFIFGPAWFSRLNTGSSEPTHNKVDPKAAAVAKADYIEKRGKPSESQRALEKETPKEIPKEEPRKEEPKKETAKEEPKKEQPKKEEPKKEDPKKEEPRKEEPSVAKQLRLKQVRQLLNDAEMANEKGQYLEAVLGFGQAAVLYPQELAEVEDPEKVRVKFIDALKRYQAEVERALQKATEQKPGERQPDSTTSGPNSR